MHILFIYNISGELLVDAMTTGFHYTLNQKICYYFLIITDFNVFVFLRHK